VAEWFAFAHQPHKETPRSEGKTTQERYELELIPLPAGGQIDSETARTWVREEMYKYGMLIQAAFEPGLELPAPEDEHDAPLFGFYLLFDDIQTMARASVEVLTSGEPVTITRSNQWDAERFLPIILSAFMQASGNWDAPAFDPNEVFGPIISEVYRRHREAEANRAAEWKPRKPPLSSLSPEEQALHGCE